MALVLPAADQRREHRRQRPALQLGVQGMDLGPVPHGEGQQMPHHVAFVDAVAADQLVQRRQRGRQLHVTEGGAVDEQERTARGRGPSEEWVRPQRSICRNAAAFICHPAAPCGARRLAEHVDEAVERELHLPNGPRRVPMANLVLPEDVVPGVHAAFVTSAQRRSHRLRRDLADVGARQQSRPYIRVRRP